MIGDEYDLGWVRDVLRGLAARPELLWANAIIELVPNRGAGDETLLIVHTIDRAVQTLNRVGGRSNYLVAAYGRPSTTLSRVHVNSIEEVVDMIATMLTKAYDINGVVFAGYGPWSPRR